MNVFSSLDCLFGFHNYRSMDQWQRLAEINDTFIKLDLSHGSWWIYSPLVTNSCIEYQRCRFCDKRKAKRT